MDDLMLHVLDIAINSVAAQAHAVRVRVEEDRAEDRLVIRIADDGLGMGPDMITATQRNFATSKLGRARPIGLGLALLKHTAEMCNGVLAVISRPGKGALVDARMQYSHIDRPPLGDCVSTIFDLVVGNPHVGFRFTHCTDQSSYSFDSRTVKRLLGEARLLQQPDVLRWIRHELERGERLLAGESAPVAWPSVRAAVKGERYGSG